MLSPSIKTKSKGNCSCASRMRSAVSYCKRSPVPKSPITAKRTDPLLSGRVIFCAAAGSAKTAPRRICIRIRGMASGARWRIRKCALENVNHQMGFGILQNQVFAHNAVLDLLGQSWKVLQQRRRYGSDGDFLRVGLVHEKVQLDRLSLHDRAVDLLRALARKGPVDRVPELLLRTRRKNVPWFRVFSRFRDLRGQRLLVFLDLFRGGLLAHRRNSLALRVAQLFILAHLAQELLETCRLSRGNRFLDRLGFTPCGPSERGAA